MKVAHSRAPALIRAHQQLIGAQRAAIERCGVRVTYLCSALCNYSFSFETVFHWQDNWQPLHEATVQPALLQTLTQGPGNPAARALVAQLRQQTCDLFVRMGGASNQIGRTYPFLSELDDPPAKLLRDIKQVLDPDRRMNPGVLGL